MCPCLRRAALVVVVVAALAPRARAQTLVDGVLGEWGAPLYADAGGGGSPVDFGRLWGAGDAEYVVLAFETGAEVNLQTSNAITVWLDTDGDASTGEAVAGIGAEASYAFGERSGTAALPGRAPVPIDYRTLRLVSAPTVTSDRFEVAFRRDATVAGEPLFRGDAVRVVLTDGDGGDVLPDGPGGVLVPLRSEPYARPAVDLGKRKGDVRLMTYNVLRDRITQPEFRGPFERVFGAVRPDIVALQEVYASDASNLAALLGGLVPGTTWYRAEALGTDAMVLSQYPVLDVTPLCERPDLPTSCNVAALLDLGAGRRLHVVSMHPPCCTNDRARQAEFDLLAAHLRDARASGALAPETGVVVTGDMNLVGDRRQLETLLTGRIADTGRFGPGAPPDADGTALADAAPRTTGLPADFTWVNDGDRFPPGRLDYVAYSDAVLEAGNGFALYTPALTEHELAEYGLEADDTAVSDHLPVVQDLAFRASTETGRGPASGAVLESVGPNPARGLVTVRYRLDRLGPVRIAVLDVLGRTVRVVKDGGRAAGAHAVVVDVGGLAAGAYAVRLDAAGQVSVRPFVVAQ